MINYPPDCCVECQHYHYDEDTDECWCDKDKGRQIVGISVRWDYLWDCPYDRRDAQERKEDYLADQADNYRKYGKEA